MFLVAPTRLKLKRVAFVVLAVYWSVTLVLVIEHFHWGSPFCFTRFRKPRVQSWLGAETTPPAEPILPERAGEDLRDSVDPLYRPFRPHDPPEGVFPRLRPTRFMPTPCLESWLVHGQLDCPTDALGPEDKLDIIWLWVNGSDTRWADEANYWIAHHKINSGAKHFREQNELLYSMRSVLASLGGAVRNLHLVLYDYAFDSKKDARLLPPSTIKHLQHELRALPPLPDRKIAPEVAAHLEQEWRVVQTPRWLDFSAVNPEGDGPRLRYAGHSEIFHLPTAGRDGPLDSGEHAWAEREWKKEALPTYNSMSIESRLGFLPGLQDTAVAFNDDFFLLKPLAASDFHSMLYGNIQRYKLSPHLIPVEIQNHLIHNSGEVGGLFHANWILSKRFPARGRPYIEHVPKVITRSLQDEATLMFAESIANASSKRFRELHVGLGDLQTQWLQSLLRVERWREGLLWTWIVAKLGGKNGEWSDGARTAVADLFKREPGSTKSVVDVVRGPRRTRDKAHIEAMFEKAGWEAPKGLEILFSSLDGHLLTAVPKPGEEYNKCALDLNMCFGSFWSEGEDTTAAHIFKHVTFRNPECGDCLIMALVTASGELGLSEFFPPKNATFKTAYRTPLPDYIPPPHLPLTRTWEEADFSLASVLAGTSMPGETVNLQLYTLRLLSRYIYSHARSGVEFHQLKTPENTKEIIAKVDKADSSVLCLNDDIEKDYPTIISMVGDWFEKRWPDKAVWERR